MKASGPVWIGGLAISLLLAASSPQAFDLPGEDDEQEASQSLPSQPVNPLRSAFSFFEKTINPSADRKLEQVRQTEAAQHRGMLSADVKQALTDLNRGTASNRQRMLLFVNNDRINNAGLVGAIDNTSYQNAQKDFAALNQWMGKASAQDVGASFKVQQRPADKPYDPGTDSDYITQVTHPEQVRGMQSGYNERVNALVEHYGVGETRNDWHNKLDTDFMADPAHVDGDDFGAIGELNNDACLERESARYEALSRMTPQQLKAAGYPDGKLPLRTSGTYNSEMDRMADKKADKINKALNTPEGREKLRSDPHERAHLQKIQAQQQKYIKRKQEAAERTRQMHDLEGVIPPRRPQPTRADVEATTRLAAGYRRKALQQGKSQAEADMIERQVMKSLDQFDRPPLDAVSDLPKRASKRGPESHAATQAASAIAPHLKNQASMVFAQTVAEYAGTDSSAEQQALQDIARATRDLSPSEQGEVMEKVRQSYEKGMKRTLTRSMDPGSAEGHARPKADNFMGRLAQTMRGEAGDSGKASATGPSYRNTRPRGDVAVIDKGARVTPIDQARRKAAHQQAGRTQTVDVAGNKLLVDEDKVLDAAQAAYNTGRKLGDSVMARVNCNREQAAYEKALAENRLDAAARHNAKADEYCGRSGQALGEEHGRALSKLVRSQKYGQQAEQAEVKYERYRDSDPQRAEAARTLAEKYRKLEVDTFVQGRKE